MFIKHKHKYKDDVGSDRHHKDHHHHHQCHDGDDNYQSHSDKVRAWPIPKY